MPSSAEADLVRHLQRARLQHQERAGSSQLAAGLDRLAAWQSKRLNATYADLGREPRYARAIDFFRSDLYGPGDFSRRDADLTRIVPLMVRVLPGSVIATVARAVELATLSQELDRALLGKLPARASLSVSSYCAAYRSLDNRGAREQQIALIVAVGRALDRYVARPVVRSALAAMRRPARLAGFSALHGLLERGFAAFRQMGGASAFLATIEMRETALMNAIFSGERAPFPEP